MAGDSELSTLKRGLLALRFINERGPTNVAALARHITIPRTNAHRILQTLVAEGYCARVANSRFYRLTSLVSHLSVGFDGDERLTTIATPLLEAVSREIKWPVALATPQGPHMLVRVATDFQSPLALVRVRPGYTTPICQTTTGLLYMALMAEDVRQSLLHVIRRRDEFDPYKD